MPKIETLGSIEIKIFFDDTKKHKAPHFHAANNDRSAVIGLPGLNELECDLRNKEWNDVIEWATANLKKLIREWDRCNPHAPVKTDKSER